MSNEKAAAYHGIENVKACKRINGARGAEIFNVPYADNLSLSPAINTQEKYADNRKVIVRHTDNGATGDMGFTAPDSNLESANGTKIKAAKGYAHSNASGRDRFDIYYEYTESFEGGTDRVIKNWLLNVGIGSPEQNHKTDAESIEFGDFVYPIVVYGDIALGSDGKVYVDENGVKRLIHRVSCEPGDTDYTTFDSTVPEAIIAEEEESGT